MVREIMRPEELTNAEKRDQLHSLVPADVFKIDNLNKATPEQLAQLEAGLEIAQALEQMPQNSANERNCFNSKRLC
jgi:hypothetical protein